MAASNGSKSKSLRRLRGENASWTIFFPCEILDLGDGRFEFDAGEPIPSPDCDCNSGGGLSGRILPPSKSSSAVKGVRSNWPLKLNSKSSFPIASLTCSLLLVCLVDLGTPGLSSQRKGTEEEEAEECLGNSSSFLRSWKKKGEEEGRLGLVGALKKKLPKR